MGKGFSAALDPLRPIGARALKSLMDTLRLQMEGAHVLDLYSGQGRIGLACLREGARQVTFVENDPQRAEAIRKEIRKKKANAEVITQDVFQYLKKGASTHGAIIFADPPFPYWNEAFQRRLIDLVARQEPVLFIIKYPSHQKPPQTVLPFFLTKERRFGESTLLYLTLKNVCEEEVL